jgi:hypothetical protein
MEKARTDRANNQAEDRVPAAKTASRPNRKIKEEDAAVVVPARVKAGVAVVDRDKVAVREAVAVAGAVAVKTVEQKPKKGGKYHATIRQKRSHGGRFHDRRSQGNLRARRCRSQPA